LIEFIGESIKFGNVLVMNIVADTSSGLRGNFLANNGLKIELRSLLMAVLNSLRRLQNI